MQNNNALQVFSYNNRQVRTTIINGEVWFVAKDVCDILSLHNARKAVKLIDDEEKMTVTNSYTHSGQRGGAQWYILINEPGLYALVLRSNKPEAKQFSRWVRHDVLPTIRTTGTYSVSTPPCVQSQIDALKADVARLTSENNALRKYIQEHHTFTILGEAISLMSGCLHQRRRKNSCTARTRHRAEQALQGVQG